MAQSNLVKTVAIKDENGLLGSDYKIGAGFNEIVDDRAGKTTYTLAQFFDSYMDFMKNSYFVYYGVNEPTNTHIPLWIDTAHTNQDQNEG